MGEFRIGRTFARHSYPDTPRAGGLAALARNFAQGPGGDTATPITAAGILVPWATIESGAPPGVSVPITPAVTGRVRISAVLTILNASGASAIVSVQAQTTAGLIAFPLVQATVDASVGEVDGFEAVPFLLDFLAPVGVVDNIQLFVTASADGALFLTLQSSTIDVQELLLATG